MKKIILLTLGLGILCSPLYQKYIWNAAKIPSTIYNFFVKTDPEIPLASIKDLEDSEAKIQVALLLDTSNSMDGLIDQAKSQLWKMVNELSTVKRDGQEPQIELALYHYGNSTLSGNDLFIQKLSDLSGDLDDISEKLFSLKTSGGNEYCGAVIKNSLEELKWSASHNDLKLIIIAGNEPFSQGPVDFRNFCSKAKTNGIQINTIFCGDYTEGKNTGWMEGAMLAEGKYLNIDQDVKVRHISTPYDDQIIKLNNKLNETYIGYGSNGVSKMNSQISQDLNASSYGTANARSRAAVKAKKSYNNSSWDLVDAVEKDEAILVNESELPAEMKAMDLKERKKYVEGKTVERQKIQQQILALEKKSKEFEKNELAQSTGTNNTLDEVLIETVKLQAAEKKFRKD